MKVHGLLLLDKPRGLSSNLVLQKVRRLLDADKAGHGGTLDPLAEGLLPLLFGEACKLAESALEGDKTYEATLRLGQITTTDDTEGEVVCTAPVAFTDAELDQVLARFRGALIQVPPVYSALKVAGKALYRYAREGTPLAAAPRRVFIHQLQLLSRRGGAEPALALRIACSKGTYIRSLARDIGGALGCGAHLEALRRTVVGRFSIAGAVSLDALAAMSQADRYRKLVALEALVAHWPRVTLDDACARRFRQGQAVPVPSDCVLPAAGGDADDGGNDGSAAARPSRIAVHEGGRLIGFGRSVAATDASCLLAPARVIVS